MKKIILVASLFLLNTYQAQFKVNVTAPSSFTPSELYIYTLNGSKDVLAGKATRKGNTWDLAVKEPYAGMMKLYIPETNASINFISENKDIRLNLEVDKNKITNVDYLDPANKLMSQLQDVQQKKEVILPALYQIKAYYKSSSPFASALDQEINRLSSSNDSLNGFPFVNFYNTNYSKFLEKSADKKKITHDDIISFITKSNEFLESSSLLKPVLIAYLNISPKEAIPTHIDQLLAAVNVETPRGQTVMSELIEIFDTYSMQDLKTRYLTQAKNLKCTINERLSQTIENNLATEIGATFPNQNFVRATNTNAKSLLEVKADKKIIIFWASTCAHCENELPKIIEKYRSIKALNGEVIAFSLDNDMTAYSAKVKMLPWINDSELKGWNSSYAEKYNLHATPTYFVLDQNNKIIAKPDHAADVISYLKLN